MNAIVFTQYGPPDVLQVKEVAKPSPKDNEILIRIHATPVNFGDVTVRNIKEKMTVRKFSMPTPFWLPARMEFGFNKPNKSKTILGSDLAGVVEAAGRDVTKFKTGDEVFAYRSSTMGANAEYVCMSENGLVALKPRNMSFVEAAAVPYGALTALNLLGKANIQPGQKVLINGASGSIGSAAVQLAKHYGAEVTGVCGTPRMDMVKAIGADHVIDYTKEDFTHNGETYDLIFDILGKSSFSKCKNSLTPNGRYLLASFKTRQLFQMLWTRLTGEKRVVCALSSEKQEGLVQIKELVEVDAITSIIDRTYPLEQAAEAHRYFESGHKKGNVILTIGENT